jgi:hypothetical protein
MNDIKIDVRGIGCFGVDWIDLAQDRDQLSSPVNTIQTSQRYLPQDRTPHKHRYDNLKSCVSLGLTKPFQRLSLMICGDSPSYMLLTCLFNVE